MKGSSGLENCVPRREAGTDDQEGWWWWRCVECVACVRVGGGVRVLASRRTCAGNGKRAGERIKRASG